MKKNRERVLVTGGLGYIGSHTVVSLSEQGYEPVIVDNLANSSETILSHLRSLTREDTPYEKCDIRDTGRLEQIIQTYKPSSVIHFAGLKSVRESIEKPVEYYSNNVAGTLSVISAMQKQNLKKIIFSSSATVYGNISSPAIETMELGEPMSPYGTSKLQCEQLLNDVARANTDWTIVILRYFNPIGAHPSGVIGENPVKHPENLMPYITGVASGELPKLQIFGDDYPTPDGTCIRDYIHVMDLAEGHLATLRCKKGLVVYNLGTGKGYSVKEIIDTFEKVNNVNVPFEIIERRLGDAPIITANPSKAHKELGWQSKFTLTDMCRDAWSWQSQIQ